MADVMKYVRLVVTFILLVALTMPACGLGILYQAIRGGIVNGRQRFESWAEELGVWLETLRRNG